MVDLKESKTMWNTELFRMTTITARWLIQTSDCKEFLTRGKYAFFLASLCVWTDSVGAYG